jgi:acyl-CoA synthetase (NDP forming)
MGSVWAENVIAQCQKISFSGDIWPVHPKRTQIAGLPCFASLADLPSAPDATFIGVNRHITIDVVGELAAMNAGGAICFASGWAESGDNDLQDQLTAAAGDMPILGPNCYGLINMLDGAVIWPDQHGTQPCDSGVAILSQSSNIAINLTMQARGLPVAYVGCLGNAAQVGMAELSGALLNDSRVTALGIYAEGFGDTVALAQMANQARMLGKGVVILKSGKSEAGAAAAASHTAALSGSHATSSAFMRQAGIGEVDTLAELVETLKILHVHGPITGRNICSLSCSGGEAGLVADLARNSALDFAPLSGMQTQNLSEILGPLVTLSNPLDYHTFIWGDLQRTTDVFTETLRPYDAGFYLIDPPRPDHCDPSSFEPALEAIEAAQVTTGKPAFPVASLPENFDEPRIAALMERGLAPLCGLETALRAVEAASTPATSNWEPWPTSPERDTHMLDETEGKSILDAVGIAIPKGLTNKSLENLIEEVDSLNAPLVLKGLGFAHKTEAGAVRLNLAGLRDEVEMPGATGYLVEEMVGNVVAELIVGVRRDAVYGASVLLGFGGVHAEILEDTQILVLPCSEDDIRNALSSLQLAPLINGFRGAPEGDVEAVIDVVLKLQNVLVNNADIEEIEINPLMVLAKGAVAVDALVRKEVQ